MRNTAQEIARLFAGVPEQESIVGVFVSQDGPVATVDVSGRRLHVLSATQTPVLPSDPVRLERRGQGLVMTGPTLARSTLGRVTVAGDPATVEYPDGSGVTAVLPVASGLSVSVDDTVVLDWSTGGAVIAVLASTVDAEEPDAPGGGGDPITVVFNAVQSGSYGSSWWTDEVWASSSYIGGWFYGTKIKDTIPDSAVILSASMWLPARSLFGDPPNFAVHTSAFRPGGGLTFGATTPLSPREGQVAVPTGWIDTLKAADGGIGVNHGGRNVYRGLSGDGRSGELTVTYQA
tara:strand:- start:2473 stop:3342 length:870 start_codon:yes stop_codon:yes gene_type:complete